MVNQKNYHQARDCLKEVIPQWYDEYVEPDAKATENHYPGKPEVSLIASDGFSKGENTYMLVSINTAMSISSAMSNDSPPSYVYKQERQLPTDASTLDGSRAPSSVHGRCWADTVRESSSSFSSHDQKNSKELLAIQNALKHDLDASKAEVADCKACLAQMEATGKAQEENEIDDGIQAQVNRVIQDQFTTFATEMTAMFAQMMLMHQQQTKNNTMKRHAEQNDVFQEGFDEQSVEILN